MSERSELTIVAPVSERSELTIVTPVSERREFTIVTATSGHWSLDPRSRRDAVHTRMVRR